MISEEEQILKSYIMYGINKHIKSIEDYNGFYLMTLDNGKQIEIHYRFRNDIEVLENTELEEEQYWEASNEADESLRAHVHRRM